MESTIERFELIMKYYSLDKKKFADKVGMKPTTLDHILKGHKKPTIDILKKICSAFPEINEYWIILGQGSIYGNSEVSKVIEAVFSNEVNVRRIKELLTNILENPDI